MPRIPYKFQV